MRRLVLLAGTLIGSGCSEDPAGVWLFEIAASDGYSCESTVEAHNFLNALEGQGSDPWAETSSFEASSQLLFGQILGDENDGWTLVLGDRLYTGIGSGSAWQFDWANSEEGGDEQTHQLGYRFSHDYGDQLNTVINMTFAGHIATGSVKMDSETWDQWAETDNWGEPVGLNAGQIPAADYVLVQRGPGSDGPVVEGATNSRDAPDCSGEECELSVSDTCSGEQTITGTRYPLEDGVPLELLEGAGEPAGLGLD